MGAEKPASKHTPILTGSPVHRIITPFSNRKSFLGLDVLPLRLPRILPGAEQVFGIELRRSPILDPGEWKIRGSGILLLW